MSFGLSNFSVIPKKSIPNIPVIVKGGDSLL